MKILLAADGSEFTRKAARFLAGHVAQFREAPEVFVHHVHAPFPFPGAMGALGKDTIEKYQREQCQGALAPATQELNPAGIDATTSWSVGDAATEINAFVKKHAIDMVVMGSHGHGSLAGFAMGSVATKLMAVIQVPVLVVR